MAKNTHYYYTKKDKKNLYSVTNKYKKTLIILQKIS